MNHRATTLLLLTLALICGELAAQQQAVVSRKLVSPSNSDFESDADGNQWPDGWATLKAGGSWELEGANHFLRLQSNTPNETVMLYQEFSVPEDVKAVELSWRQRVTGLKTGNQGWFDARIMLEWMNASREKVSPNPSAPATRKDTDGWVQKSVSFIVPAEATTLKFMPCLLQVVSGTFDLDDIKIQSTDPTPILAAMDKDADARKIKLDAERAKRQGKADANFQKSGSLISNGGFEIDQRSDDWPDDWGRPKTGGTWKTETPLENRFLRLTSTKPDEMVMVYRAIDIPSGIEALELTWRQRISGLKVGSSPWFDARIMLEFHSIDGKKLSPNPSPAYSQKDTDGWVEKSIQMLVPQDAMSIVLMPCLFQAKAGTFDLDDLRLTPTDAQALILVEQKRASMKEASRVPTEQPLRANWPKALKVVGNRVQDTDGKDVWLQGVNAGGLETLPHDKQVLKSVVVAIDDWKSNCVRLPIKESFWYGESPYQKDKGQGYREIIDQAITLAANRGSYLVVDLHRFRAPTQAHADFWKEFSAVYKDHPAVLFDIFNEPHGISWEVWQRGGFVGDENSKTDESAFLNESEKQKNKGFHSIGMQGLVDAVRSSGAKNIIIAGGVFWCNDLSGITNGFALHDPNGNGIMYSWHTYNWHTGWEEKVLATAAKHPIFLGEVGADIHKMDFIPAADQEDPYTWVPDMLGFVQKHHLHWTGWCLHPKATPLLISDWDYKPTPYWGKFAQEALSGKQFEMKRTR